MALWLRHAFSLEMDYINSVVRESWLPPCEAACFFGEVQPSAKGGVICVDHKKVSFKLGELEQKWPNHSGKFVLSYVLRVLGLGL